MRRSKTSGTIFANFRFKGKLFRHSLETTDKTIARNKLAELRRKLETGTVRDEENATVSELFPKFLQSLAKKSDSVQIRSRGHMKHFCKCFGDLNPRDIKPMEIQEWLQELRGDRGFAPRSVLGGLPAVNHTYTRES